MDWGDIDLITENGSPEERCHQSVIVHGMPRNYCEYKGESLKYVPYEIRQYDKF